MASRVLFALGATLVAAGLGATLAHGQTYDFALEPDDGSVWITGPTPTGFVEVLAEWRADGKVERLTAPFSPFTYRNPRAPTSLAPVTTIDLGGRFGVLSQFRGLYRRDPGGKWAVSDVFASDPGRFNCEESANTPSCLLVLSFTDSRGEHGVEVFDQNETVHYLYQDGDGYRKPRGAEANLTDVDFFDYKDFVWSDDDSKVLIPNQLGPTTGYGFTVVTATTRDQRTLNVGGSATTFAEQTEVLKRGGRFFAAQSVIDTTTGVNSLVLYRLDDPFAVSPAATRLFQVPAASNGVPLQILGMDAGSFYFQNGAQVFAVSTAAGAGAPAKAIATCPAGTFGYAGLSDDTVPPGSRTWVVCGQQVLLLQGGALVQQITAAGSLVAGRVLRDEGGAFDIALALSGGSFQRILPDGTSTTISLTDPGTPPSLSPVWEEAAGICGVTYAGDGTTPVMCQKGGVWSVVTDHLPTPFAVMRGGSTTWALSHVGNQLEAYSLAGGAGGPGAWKLVQSWPWASSPGPAQFGRLVHRRPGEGGQNVGDQPVPTPPTPPTQGPQPALIAYGNDQVAIDLSDGHLWIPSAGGFVQSFPHPSDNGAFGAVVATDGMLYDFCGNPGGGNGPGPQPPAVPLCAFAADGTTVTFGAPLPQTVYYGSAYSLKRGVLIAANGDAFVVRGERAIELGHLFGQFQSTDPNQPLSLDFRDLGGGALLIRRSSYDPTSGNSTSVYFQYDGETLTQLPWTDHQADLTRQKATRKQPRSKRRGQSVPSAPANGTAGSGSALQTWLGADGIWRSTRGGGNTTLVYGENPVDASYSTLPQSPDYVNAAVSAGDDLILATNAGLWTCPLANATPVTTATDDLPTTAGCGLKVALPFVHAVRQVLGVTLVQSGDQLARVNDGGDGVERLSRAPGARGLGVAGVHASWVEGNQFTRYAVLSGRRLTLPLPQGVQGPGVVATAPRWLCAATGLFWLTARHEWQAVAAVPACVGMASRGNEVFVTTSAAGFLCRRGACRGGVPVPGPLLDDYAVGTLAHGFGLALGGTLYAFDGQRFTDATPRYARGSLLLAPATSVVAGIIGLEGGGAVMTSGDGDAWHLRPE